MADPGPGGRRPAPSASPLLDSTWIHVPAFGPVANGPHRPTKIGNPPPSDDDDDHDDDDDRGWTLHLQSSDLVTLDIGTRMERLTRANPPISLVGIQGPTPFLRLGNHIFRGQWEEAIGTEIILTDDHDTTLPFPDQHVIRPLMNDVRNPTETADELGATTASWRIRFRPAMKKFENLVAQSGVEGEPGEGGDQAAAPSSKRAGKGKGKSQAGAKDVAEEGEVTSGDQEEEDPSAPQKPKKKNKNKDAAHVPKERKERSMAEKAGMAVTRALRRLESQKGDQGGKGGKGGAQKGQQGGAEDDQAEQDDEMGGTDDNDEERGDEDSQEEGEEDEMDTQRPNRRSGRIKGEHDDDDDDDDDDDV